ncbi:unnamed protein product [Ascophyllum nodosum]
MHSRNRDDVLTLTPEQSHRIIAVLEESSEKLGFLGSITPDLLQHRDELSKFVGDEISRIIQEQRLSGARYEKLIAQRSSLKGLTNKSRYKEIQAEIQGVSLALRESTKNLCRNLKDSPNISGNLLKIEGERTELSNLLNATCREIAKIRSFQAIVGIVEDDRLAQCRQVELVRREKEATQAVKKLEAEVFSERAEHARQLNENRATLVDLKQTLLTVKSKTSVDIKYSRKEHSARVSSLLRVYEQHERQLELQVKELERVKQVEVAVHQQTMEFLEKKKQLSQDRLDEWEEKYGEEVEALERTFAELTDERNAMLDKLEGLKERKYHEEQEQRAREEAKRMALRKERERIETERRQNHAAKVIQRLLREFMRRQIASKMKKGGGKKKGKKGGGMKGKKGTTFATRATLRIASTVPADSRR